MKKLTLIFALLLSLKGMAQDFEWARQIGGADFEFVSRTVVDASGHVYTLGSFTGTIDLDPSSNTLIRTSAGSNDIYLQKLDGNGNLIWAKTMGSSNSDTGGSLALDSAGNIYASGTFQGTVDFDPNATTTFLSSNGQRDGWVAKFSPAGNLQWAHHIGGTDNDYLNTVAVDGNQNLSLAGSFRGTVDFDPSSATANRTSAGNSDVYVLKLDANGNFLWTRTFGGTDFASSSELGHDAQDNIYISGVFKSTVDFDPSAATVNLTSNGGEDAYILKLDSNGDFVWVRSVGGTNTEYVHGIQVASDGSVYTSGSYQLTMDFDPSAAVDNRTSNGSNDLFLLKLDANGDYQWAWTGGGVTEDETYDLAIDVNQNVYATGYFGGTIDFDPTPATFNLTASGTNDIFLAKFSPSGNLQWAEKFGMTSSNIGESVTIGPAGEIVAGGRFRSTTDFDPSASTANLTVSGGLWDCYVIKFSQCLPSTSSQTVTFCNSYNWNGSILTSSGTYQDTIMNAMGCDSIRVLNLTINNASSSTETATACDSYTWNGNVYTNSGTYRDTITNSVGCDSVRTLNLTVNNSAATTEVVDACGPYTWNGQVYSVSGTYNETLMTAAGCDSIATLSLSIPVIDTSVSLVSGNTLVSAAVGVSYQWIDCATQMPIPNATNASFSPTASGSYAVVLRDSVCEDTSACQNVTLLGLDNRPAFAVSASPNPSNGQVTVQLPASYAEVKVQVLAMTGQYLADYRYSNVQSARFPLPAAAGIYFLRVTTDTEESAVLKVVRR